MPSFPNSRFPLGGLPFDTIAIGRTKKKRKDETDETDFPSTPNGTPLLWFKADDLTMLWQDAAGSTAVTADGQTVGKWGSSHPSVTYLAQSTNAAWEPTYKVNILNSRAGIKFDGTDDAMQFDTGIPAASLDDCTMFAVVSGWTTGTGQIILGSTIPSNGGMQFAIQATDKASIAVTGTAAIGESTSAYPTTGAIIVAQLASGVSYAFYKGLTANGGAATAEVIANATAWVGAQQSGGTISDFFNGYLHELLIFDSVLSDAARIANTNYLRGRWGTAL